MAKNKKKENRITFFKITKFGHFLWMTSFQFKNLPQREVHLVSFKNKIPKTQFFIFTTINRVFWFWERWETQAIQVTELQKILNFLWNVKYAVPQDRFHRYIPIHI